LDVNFLIDLRTETEKNTIIISTSHKNNTEDSKTTCSSAGLIYTSLRCSPSDLERFFAELEDLEAVSVTFVFSFSSVITFSFVTARKKERT